MKCTIPEISWHNREPVLSVDIHPLHVTNNHNKNSIVGGGDSGDHFYRLASGGADCHVLIWQVNVCGDSGNVKIEPLADLTRHQKAVNAVRWSPNGGVHLASADDDANIIIWHRKMTDTSSASIPPLEGVVECCNDSDDTSANRETWLVHKVMRGHKDDIYDLNWSPDGAKILSGSIDNTAILWSVAKGLNEKILTEHKGFVQGVTWDPKGAYFATIATDRVCRVYDAGGRQLQARIARGILPLNVTHALHAKDVKYFHDDTFKSFFRRLDFSPDGALLAVPSGKIENDDGNNKDVMYATYLFAVDSWKRMVLAIGTDHDIVLYDTEQRVPFAYFRDVHYTRLTDLSWSRDGRLLIASSTDGFTTIITFAPHEIGTEYSERNATPSSDANETQPPLKSEQTKKPSFLETWTKKTPKNAATSSSTKPRLIQVRKTPRILTPPQTTTNCTALQKSETILIDDDENVAQDAWKCGEEAPKSATNENKAAPLIDDCTEEFSLRLEDSCHKVVKKRVPLITLSSPKQKKTKM